MHSRTAILAAATFQSHGLPKYFWALPLPHYLPQFK